MKMRKLRRATYEEMLRGEIDQLSAMNEPTLRLVKGEKDVSTENSGANPPRDNRGQNSLGEGEG
jgi:hypothetical protein